MSEKQNPKVKITCRNVWKVFGSRSEQALELIKDTMTKDKILDETGHVLAIKYVCDFMRDISRDKVVKVKTIMKEPSSSLKDTLEHQALLYYWAGFSMAFAAAILKYQPANGLICLLNGS